MLAISRDSHLKCTRNCQFGCFVNCPSVNPFFNKSWWRSPSRYIDEDMTISSFSKDTPSNTKSCISGIFKSFLMVGSFFARYCKVFWNNPLLDTSKFSMISLPDFFCNLLVFFRIVLFSITSDAHNHFHAHMIVVNK